jgi:flagellar biosynthesis protein FlhF
MKIRKYFVQDMKEGMQRIRAELGPEAVIVESRKVRLRGLKGYFTPRQVEITAVVETFPRQEKVQAQLQEANFQKTIREELVELRHTIGRLVGLGKAPGDVKEEENEGLRRWKLQLNNQELFGELIQELMDEIRRSLLEEAQLTEELIGLVLRREIGKRLVNVPEGGAPIQVFIGPTGVGKTTTLAKLAARYSLYQGEKVGIITIDHYRIGAIDQLRTYSEITGLPLDVVMSPRELRQTIEKYAGYQRILIDTAGRSALNKAHIQELAGYLQVLPPAEIFLVVSATTKSQDLRLITENFSCMGYNRLIYTKLDETNTYGVLVNGAYLTNLPIIYLTTGQGVPDDIRLADREVISSLILGDDD